MARAGRPRKAAGAALRHPCGKIRTPRQRAVDERAFVALQPHRREHGLDQRCASSLGRFTLAHGLEPALYDAGQTYGALVSKWRSICVEARDSLVVFEGGTGNEVPDEVVAEMRERIDGLERALLDAGGAIGKQIIDKLALDHIDWPPDTARAHPVALKAAIAALQGLADHIERGRRRR